MGIATVIAAASFVISAASSAYQVIQAKKAQAEADKAAERRRGFEIPIEATAIDLPLVYGRAKVGGARTWHRVASSYVYPGFNNADKVMETGPADYTGYTTTFEVFGSSIEVVNNTPSTSTVDVPASTAPEGGYLSQSLSGKKNEFLFFQQALCVGPINQVLELIVDESRYIDDPTLGSYGHSDAQEINGVKAALRIDCHYSGGVADAVTVGNFAERATATFDDMAYIAAVVRIDRAEPQFNSVPVFQFLVEGRKVKTSTAGVLSGSRAYSANPVWCLLDYLMDPDVGKGLDISEIDLTTFEAAAPICDAIVQEDVLVGGKMWKPTDGSRSITARDLPRYECNVVLDTTKPIRENIETILSTMGDARLIWSAGVYRLSLQVPATNAALTVAEVITDNELVLDQQIEINWPTGSERYNFATIRFHNEFENFKEDSVSWPPKLTASYVKGIGGTRYPPPNETWDDDSGGGRLLNAVGVWSGASDTTSLSYNLRVTPAQMGTYTLKYTGDDSITITITDTSNASVVHTGSRTGLSMTTTTVSLGHATEDRVYAITITGNNSGDNRRGVAAKLDNATTVLWTTRDVTYTNFVTVNTYSDVYDTMLEEDGGIELETSLFAEGITDPYHALAKAEELVRTSRSAFNVKFAYRLKDRFLEPGDFIRLESESLQLGEISDLFLRVSSVKVKPDGVCDVVSNRFDASQLAWNVKDDVYLSAPPIFIQKLSAPSDLLYSAAPTAIVTNSGKLTWSASPSADANGYVVYKHDPSSDPYDEDGVPVFNEIGRTNALTFLVPPLSSASAIFGVRTQGIDGKLSPMAITDRENAVTLSNSWMKNVVLTASANAFIKVSTTGVVTPSSITLTATPSNFTSPVYSWYVDGVVQGGETASTFVLNSFTTPSSKRVEVWVRETDGFVVTTQEMTILYLEEGSSGLSAVLTNDSHSIPTDSAGANGVYTGSGTSIYVYEGASALDYDGVGTAAGKWTVSRVASGITAGALSDGGTYAINADHSAITASVATVTYTITGKTLGGVAFTITKVQTLTRLKSGVGAISLALTQPSVAIPTDGAGSNPIFTNSGTQLNVTEGGTALTYDGVGSATGTWTVSTNGNTTITPGAITDGGAYSVHAAISAFSADTGKITYTVTGKRLDGSSFSAVVEQTFVKVKGAVLDTTPSGPPVTAVGGAIWAMTYETQPNGSIIARATTSWLIPATNNSDIQHYEVSLRLNTGPGAWTTYITSTLTYNWVLPVNTAYDVSIVAVDTSGNKSTALVYTNKNTSNQTGNPTAPTPGTAVPDYSGITLSWTNSADATLAQVQVFKADVASGAAAPSSASATKITTRSAIPNEADTFRHTGLATGRDYYYWFKSVSSYGTTSSFSTRVGPVALELIDGGNIAPGTIDGGGIENGTIDSAQFKTGAVTGPKVSPVTAMSFGTGNNSITISGADAAYRMWAGHAAAASAPWKVTPTGKMIATDFEQRTADGTLHWSSAAGHTVEGINQLLSLSTGQMPVSGAKAGAVTHISGTPSGSQAAGAFLAARLSAASTVTISIPVLLDGVATTDTFPTTVTFEVFERYKLNVGDAFGAWSSKGTKTLTKVTSGSPTSSQYLVSAVDYPVWVYDSELGYDVLDYATRYVPSTVGATLSVTGAAKAAGFYEYAVKAITAAPWTSLSSIVTVTDTDGKPSYLLTDGSSGSVNFAHPTGAYGALKATQTSPTGTSLSVEFDFCIAYTSSATARTIREFSGSVSVAHNGSVYTTVGINGVSTDMGTAALSTYAWVYVYAISNGVTDALLASSSASAPVLPTGYSYFKLVSCFKPLGAYIPQYSQKDDTIKFIGVYPAVFTGNQGTGTSTSPGYVTNVDGAGTSVKPDIIPAIAYSILVQARSSGSGILLLNARSGGTGYNSTTPPSLVVHSDWSLNSAEIVMESDDLYYWGNDADCLVRCTGFTLLL